MRVRKLPVEINAIRFTGANLDDVKQFAAQHGTRIEGTAESLVVHTIEGTMTAKPGHYILSGVHDEIYPCDPDIFDKTYEVVEP